MKTNRKTGMVALLTAGTVAASSLMNPAVADKSKTYKIGALALGGVAAYMLIKRKPLPAAIAGAAGYYAYKKSQDSNNRSANRFPGDGYYGDAGNNGNVYPNSSGPYASVPDDGGATYPDDPGYGTPDGGFFPGYGLNTRKAQPAPRRVVPQYGARTVLK